MPFPDILKELREKKGFTQEQLAAVLHLSKNAISHYEKGINSPNILKAMDYIKFHNDISAHQKKKTKP